MTWDPRDWFRGSLIVARRDFLANTKSVRVIVITVLVLLVMVGAAFGLSGLSLTGPGAQYEYVLWSSSAYPTSNVSDAGIVGWVSDAFGVPRPGVDIALGEPYDPGDPTPVFIERDTQITNASGWVGFPDLGPGLWPLEMRVGSLVQEQVLGIFSVPTANYSIAFNRYDLVDDFAFRDVRLLVIERGGSPAVGATVTVNDTNPTPTDANGHWGTRLPDGLWQLNVTYLGETSSLPPVFVEALNVTPFLQGPDGVLFFLSFFLMGLFGPIVAVAVSYDALAKERQQGSLELLLVRPTSREGLALGKFLGTFASVGLPVVGVSLIGLAAIAGLTGRWPDAAFGATFVLATLGLLATYCLIMQIFSTFVRSPGTAVLSAIMVWLVFNVLWNVVFFLLTAALRIGPGTPGYFEASALSALLNPTGVYQLTLLAALPPSLFGFAGTGSGILPPWAGPVALVVWIGVLLALAIFLFRRTIV